jgi:hypothetical protein
MTQPERNYVYALLMLRWSRTIESHGLPFDVWLEQRPIAPNS